MRSPVVASILNSAPGPGPIADARPLLVICKTYKLPLAVERQVDNVREACVGDREIDCCRVEAIHVGRAGRKRKAG